MQAKFIRFAFKIEVKQASTTSYVDRYSTSHVLFTVPKNIADHILVAKTLAIREALVNIIHKQLAEVIIESASLVAVKVIDKLVPLVK